MSNKPIIVIDPGHGGSTKVGGSSPNNATGANGLLEKNLTLDMANRVAATLATQANVFLTRAGDTNLGLSDRAKFARDKDAAVFLSLHFNGFNDTAVDGTEVWVAKDAGQRSRDFAKKMLGHVAGATGVRDRGVREGDLGVILPSRHAAKTSACLLEVAFLSNPAQARRLAEEDYKQRLAEAIAAGVRDQLRTEAAQQSVIDEYSHPLYDAGEHVMTGANLYPAQLRVGKSPGVLFSYGQIIVMGDLYESVEKMMNADTAELQKIKALIERNTKYYEANKTDKKLDVSTEEWERATKERYLKLAEVNYEHFSPNLLFKDDPIGKRAGKYRNNKSEWELHHKRATKAAQDMAPVLQPDDRPPIFPEFPLIVNAFGDHFLTDAFASGHIVNREVIAEFFKANFYNGKALKPEATKFFGRVAKLAFKGDVAKKFEVLETYEPLDRWWNIFNWNPNINSAERFQTMLTEIAVQRPDAVTYLSAKAFHDRLNKDGIEVTNSAGDGPWKLTGDGFLDPTNLKIIQKAVQQSVDNVNNALASVGNLNYETYFSNVWKYVPHPTEAAKKTIKRLVQEYTSPGSELLAQAAAALIYSQVDTLIKKLKREKKLKDA